MKSLVIAAAGVVAAGALAVAQPSESGAASAQDSDDCAVSDYAMGLRYQQSAEAAALQRQSFLLAKERLQDRIGPKRSNARLAVVSDLDETVLDNTDLLARDLEACHDYTTWDTWKHWEREGHPRLIPGAAKFFAYADRVGVSIFYISDRYEENKSATMSTLRELGLPQVSSDRVLLYGPSKEERRAQVEKDHRIVLLLGDSLPDFDGAYAGSTPEAQHDQVAEDAHHFGRDWIAFPNAGYGSWSDAELSTWNAPLVVE